MRRKKVKNVYQEAGHRGGMSEVIRNFQLEMRLVENFNKDKPVYSLENSKEEPEYSPDKN